jgi:hypothetical protein
VQVIVDRTVAEEIVARLSQRDRRIGEDARAAVDWLTGFDGEELPAVFSRRELQLFLWHQLPKKWLVRPAEQLAVAEALACFFDEVGAEAATLAALCRSAETADLIRSGGGRKLASALERSGLEPPDTPLLAWSEFMNIEEALEHDLVARLLEEAIDTGEFDPSQRGWRHRQTELVERYLASPDASGAAPLVRIHATRRQAWLELPGRGDDRDLLEQALERIDAHARSPAETEAAIEPLLWLLDQLADDVKLTQTGAFPRVLVRAAVERYPDWWDTATVRPPYQEAELYPLGVLHDLIDELRLARRQRNTLQLTPKGRALHADPQRLLSEVAAMLAPELPAEFDPALARLVVDDQPEEADWSLVSLLAPFNGITVERRSAAAVTPGGRTLAAAILNARAHGPRNTLS